MGNPNKINVFILYQRVWGMKFGQFLIDQIRSQMPEANIGVITVKEQADQYFRENNNVEDFGFYEYFDPVRDDFNDYLGEDKDKFDISAICDDFKVSSIWEILQATRNHVKDYKKKYNYAYTASLNDDELQDTIKAYYKLIKKLDGDFKPDFMIIPNPVETFNIMLELYADSRNIPLRQMAPTYVKGFYQYAKNRFQGGSIIEDKFYDNASYEKCRDQAADYIKEFRENFIVPECAYHDSSDYLRITPKGLLKAVSKAGRAIWWNKKLPKGMHADHVSYSPRLILRDYFLQIKYHNALKNFDYDELPKEKFVLFPLQMQPELAIDVLAPYTNNQIETARQIAMSLPANYTLVVKEHPIMVGRRRPDYLKKIQRLPNVKLVNYNIKTQEILPKCSSIIVTTGSIIIEAALMGVPVIQLGQLQTSNMLPNVTHETDLTKLNERWGNLLDKKLHGDDYEEQLIKYISLCMEYGISTNYYEMWEQDKDGDLQPFWDKFLLEFDRDKSQIEKAAE